MLHAPKRLAMQNAVAVALESGAEIVGFFGSLPSA
jgi:hypothetical protein